MTITNKDIQTNFTLLLFSGVYHNDIEVVKWALAGDGNVLAPYSDVAKANQAVEAYRQKDERGKLAGACVSTTTPLDLAIAKKAGDEIITLLEDASLSQQLLTAAKAQNTALATLLLAKGANPDMADKHGNAPLHIAAQTGNNELVTLLLANEANPDIADNDGRTPLRIAALARNTELAALLLANEANPDRANKHGDTPLNFAARAGNTELAKLLLAHDANPRYSG